MNDIAITDKKITIMEPSEQSVDNRKLTIMNDIAIDMSGDILPL